MSFQLHHIITLACNKSCSYCINDLKEFGNSHNKRPASLDAIESRYASMAKRYSSLKISGGEPTKYKRFEEVSRLGKRYFTDMELITANTDALTNSFDWIDEVYERIYFSLHEPYIEEFYDGRTQEKFVLRNGRSISVILSCMTDFFERMLVDFDSRPEALMQRMIENGFQGLTVRQEWPNGKPLPRLLPTYANFSVQYNPKQQCESQTLLMPDLSTIDNTVVTVPVSTLAVIKARV